MLLFLLLLEGLAKAELSDIAQVGTGEHTCVLTNQGGGVKCWGVNTYGQLGNGTTTNSFTPQDVVGLASGVVAISVGRLHSCALTSAGGMKCWGYNFFGQLGDGTNHTERHTPTDVTGLGSGVAKIFAGGAHSCAITTSGAAKCWGRNEDGQLGIGVIGDRLTPTDVVGLSSNVETLALGYSSRSHSCAILSGGLLRCWGYNGYGELGDGSLTRRVSPVDVVGLGSGVVGISVGYKHSCAVLVGGSAKCWGINSDGQLGDDSTINQNLPTSVHGVSNAVSIVSGGNHNCVLTNGGQVLCWGFNGRGQLGDGSKETRLSAVLAQRLSQTAVALSSREHHTCAVLDNSTLRCWGSNGTGGLGNGASLDRFTPRPIYGFPFKAGSISAGAKNTLVNREDGIVFGFGQNGNGALGDGTATPRYQPVMLAGLTDSASVVSDKYATGCVIMNTGTLKCFGWNPYGMVGDGSLVDRLTPTQVIGFESGAMDVVTLPNCQGTE